MEAIKKQIFSLIAFCFYLNCMPISFETVAYNNYIYTLRCGGTSDSSSSSVPTTSSGTRGGFATGQTCDNPSYIKKQNPFSKQSTQTSPNPKFRPTSKLDANSGSGGSGNNSGGDDLPLEEDQIYDPNYWKRYQKQHSSFYSDKEEKQIEATQEEIDRWKNIRKIKL